MSEINIEGVFCFMPTQEGMYGGIVKIVRPLTEEEADLDEVGPMYKVRYTDSGEEADAFADELIEVK